MSNSNLLRMPPAPRYDPRTDGNPFAWIIATAPKVRAQHVGTQAVHRAKVKADQE